MEQIKRCNRCSEDKLLTEFHARKAAKDGRQAYCKPCAIIGVRAWQDRTGWKPKPRKAGESYKRHGLTVVRYEELKKTQGGLCGACGKRVPAVVDHDHACCPGAYSCGKCVRGLLCRPCNTALGLLKDEEERITALAEYLQRYRACAVNSDGRVADS